MTDDLDGVLDLLKSAPVEKVMLCPYRMKKLTADEQERAKKRPAVYQVICYCGKGDTDPCNS